ncbi:5-formyltetrahydrofolate cyclo-ligase [Acuticoccus sediminis]|uniref:5-formyltetrahydrofolate cyclo-ligase n=1 Tax=Acuticoccus sediminis TaxID=2184697 RepID=A0A8B2NZS4_9HYPH|nr:5-formyltetrahydrofolate cyclo-ligase [Acuticoccus sediminis]RAI03695.1 5-formyltetrahydrofolate cyclo-ligase [Acuticoccus sediminis]
MARSGPTPAAPGAGQSPAELKARLRTTAMLRRQEAARTVRGAGAAIAARADELPGAAIVSGYLPIRDEIDPRPLMAALGSTAQIALPKIEDGRMRFVVMGEGDRLVSGRFGLTEPSGGAEVVPDLVLVPLLAFTRTGGRLGYGAGHYDRWLGEHPGRRTVGLAYAAQELPELPIEPHDHPLDAILTEQDLIRIG